MTKGERIRELRLKKNMSQADLAKALNTTKQTISKYEKSIVTNIPSDKIEAMAILFNASPEYILGWDVGVNPVEVALMEAEMVMDEDLKELFADFKKLDKKKRKIIKDLAHSLAETNTED